MPVIQSTYKPAFYFKKGFVSTVYSGIVRQVNQPLDRQERLVLADGDFIDLDWHYAKTNSDALIIILHGLEGNAQRAYVKGTAKTFTENGVDALCVNFRGCSGEINKLYRSYHSGDTDDLKAVINHVLTLEKYTKLYLKGFSLGGNVILKYLGEGNQIPKQLIAGIAVSVPCQLAGAAAELHRLKNKLYHDRFKQNLIAKLQVKQQRHPDKISTKEIASIKTLYDFDTIYTAKAHGFLSAEDYYEKSSSLQFLNHIETPTLLINALNDSFLSAACYPVKQAQQNPNLFLEMPKYGGHVGFIDKKNYYYTEKRALSFVQNDM
ncbi:YheT family hydrolase [Bizionia sediminis]|uniref:YheT family hydrolase n=1 Tax=Bizionia sediminis TaxID=1737064 RepID=A0ABW5KSJ4_9FLAO